MIGKNASGGVISAWLTPHPPIVVPEVGRGRELEISRTLSSMRLTAGGIIDDGPDVLIFISPHAPTSGNRISLSGGGLYGGGLRRFGAKGVKREYVGDRDVSDFICRESDAAGIKAEVTGGAGRAGAASNAKNIKELDHGVAVPLYFIEEEIDRRGADQPGIVTISIAYLKNEELYEFGRCISQAAEKSGKRAALIASGDLSHKLTADGPYGYDPAGPEFDKYVLDCIAGQDVTRLLKTEEYFLEQAAQCGFYGLLMLYGAVGGDNMEKLPLATGPTIYSYEGTFGVGYAVAKIM